MATQPSAAEPSAAEPSLASPLPEPKPKKPPFQVNDILTVMKASVKATHDSKQESKQRDILRRANINKQAALDIQGKQKREHDEDVKAAQKKLDPNKHSTRVLVEGVHLEFARLDKRMKAAVAEHTKAAEKEAADMFAVARAGENSQSIQAVSQQAFLQKHLFLNANTGTSVASVNKSIAEARVTIEDGRVILDEHRRVCEQCKEGEVCSEYQRLYKDSATYNSEFGVGIPAASESAQAFKDEVQRKNDNYFLLQNAWQEHKKVCTDCVSKLECDYNKNMKLHLEQFTAEAQHKLAVEAHKAGCEVCISGGVCLLIPVRFQVAASQPGEYKRKPLWRKKLKE